jgi:uncharacterized protein (DUF1697 family)
VAKTTWIAFFRGINVGGNNPLPMKTLPALFETCGCADAKTYIQSGNVVFRSSVTNAAKLEDALAKAVHAEHGHKPRVVILSAQQLARAVKRNPYPQAEQEPKSLHLFFLGGKPQKEGLAKLASLRANGEEFVLDGSVFYLHAPNGIGKSKLAASVERALGVDTTARNWRTCTTVLEMAEALD